MSEQCALREAAKNKWTLVFHACTPIFHSLERPLADIPAVYRFVAAVDTEDLEIAFQLTNHHEQVWQLNDGVIVHVGDCRSTSVGDVMVTPDGTAHRCCTWGWRQLGQVVPLD